MTRPLDVLLRSLQLAGLEIDAEAALDSLWLSREIRSQYLLGYSSTNSINDGKYRKVRVEVTPPPGMPQLRTSWRRGYYAPEH